MVPILVDEARTFGMEGLFRQIGIYSVEPQKYEPVDRDQVMYYREDVKGQILQEGINEAGGMSSWVAAATSYSTNNRIMIRFTSTTRCLDCSGSVIWHGQPVICGPVAFC